MGAHVDGVPGDGRSHDRGARRPQARTGVHLGADGRAQARRVRTDAPLPWPRRRPEDAGEEALVAAVDDTKQTVQATAKFVRVSPRKARLVADNIRGRTVPEARTILKFTERAAAHDVEKVLRSAVANAESNPALHWNGDDLVVRAVYVNEGPTLKRWRARARGRIGRIH